MKKINSYGLCAALDIEPKIFEEYIEGLIERLQTQPQFRNLPAAKNCLELMKVLDNGYGLRQNDTYLAASRLLFNMEPLLIRLMGLPNYFPEDPVTIDPVRLKNILDWAAGYNYYERPAQDTIGKNNTEIAIDSDYFSHLIEMYYDDKIIEMIGTLTQSLRTGAFPPMASSKEISRITKVLQTDHIVHIDRPAKYQKEGSAFKKLILSICHKYAGYEEANERDEHGMFVIDTDKAALQSHLKHLARLVCEARNRIAHEGQIIMDNTKIKDALKPAFIFLSLASGQQKKPLDRTRNRISYCALNPIHALGLAIPFIRIAVIVIAALCVLWCATPVPQVQRMTYDHIQSGGAMERLFEAFAKQDTTAALKIHKDANIIRETTEAIR